MSFYHLEPFDDAVAAYIRLETNLYGFFHVLVNGNAPNITFGIKLVRDPHHIGGLVIDVMGWTGPLTSGSKSFNVSGQFAGLYLKEILIIGSNKSQTVQVKEVKLKNDKEYIEHLSTIS